MIQKKKFFELTGLVFVVELYDGVYVSNKKKGSLPDTIA